jgi:Fic family protein
MRIIFQNKPHNLRLICIFVKKEPTHYIDGIVEMMLDAVMNYEKPLTHDRLFGWHAALFPMGKSGFSDIIVGNYRTEGMEVISGTFGRERIHYRAPEPERVFPEMEKFLTWFNDQNSAPSLIKSAIAHLWFVCIHPFDDGNGRIGRAISDMVLSQTDQSKFRFFSMSLQISRKKKNTTKY